MSKVETVKICEDYCLQALAKKFYEWLEKNKKEESETTPINPLSSKEDLEKTTRQ